MTDAVQQPLKIVVTGADGFVGRALSAKLLEQGYRAVQLVRRQSAQGQVAVGDLAEFQGWPALLVDTYAVVHLAARAHVLQETVRDPLAEFRRVNVAGTLRLARAAARAGVRKFVFMSSIGVNGNFTIGRPFTEADSPAPAEPYAVSKFEAEQGLLDIGAGCDMRITRIRPPLILGPGVRGNLLRLLRLIDRNLPLPLGSIHNQRSFVVLDNLCDLLSLCLTCDRADGQLFLAAEAEEISTPALMRAMAAGLGRRSRLVAMPLPILRAMSRLVGAEAQVRRVSDSLRVDASHARALLEWKSRTDLLTAIHSMADFYRRNKGRSNAMGHQRGG